MANRYTRPKRRGRKSQANSRVGPMSSYLPVSRGGPRSSTPFDVEAAAEEAVFSYLARRDPTKLAPGAPVELFIHPKPWNPNPLPAPRPPMDPPPPRPEWNGWINWIPPDNIPKLRSDRSQQERKALIPVTRKPRQLAVQTPVKKTVSYPRHLKYGRGFRPKCRLGVNTPTPPVSPVVSPVAKSVGLPVSKVDLPAAPKMDLLVPPKVNLPVVPKVGRSTNG